MIGNVFLHGERFLAVLALCTGLFSIILYAYPNTFVRFYVKQSIIFTFLLLVVVISQIALAPIALLTGWSWIMMVPILVFMYAWFRSLFSAFQGKLRKVHVPYSKKLDVLDTLFPMPPLENNY